MDLVRSLPGMISFIGSPCVSCRWCSPTRIAIFLNSKQRSALEGFCFGLCAAADTQGRLGSPWPLCLKRGWGKTCATLPWPLSGWSLQFVFSVLTRRSPIGGSGCQGGDPAGGAERALTQERAEITVRGLPRTENRSGQS